MSQTYNTQFFERVADWIDNHEGMSSIPKQAEKYLNDMEYEKLQNYMNRVDRGLSQEYYYSNNILGANDVY